MALLEGPPLSLRDISPRPRGRGDPTCSARFAGGDAEVRRRRGSAVVAGWQRTPPPQSLRDSSPSGGALGTL